MGRRSADLCPISDGDRWAWGIARTRGAPTVPAMTTSPVTLWDVFPVSSPRLCTFASVRISTDAGDIRTIMTQAAGVLAGTPLGQILNEVPKPGTHDRDPSVMWLAAGGVPVCRGDLAEACLRPNVIVGWAWEAAGHLLVLVTASADTPDLPPLPGDRLATARNGYCELTCEALALGRPDVWHSIRADRTTRDWAFGHKMLGVAKAHGVRVVWDGVEKDLQDVGGMILASVDMAVSDAKLEDMRAAWFNGRSAMLQAGERDFSFLSMPLGYGPVLVPGPIPGTTVPKQGSVQVLPEHAGAIQQLAAAVADGRTWIDVGRLGMALGIYGLGGARSNRRTGDDVDSMSFINWSRRLFTQAKVALYRTGVYATVRRTKAARVIGHELKDGGDHRYERFEVAWGLPTLPGASEAGWGVPDGHWEAVLRRLESGSHAGGAAYRRLPLSGVPKWVDGASRFHFRPDRSRLVLQAYPAAERWHRDRASTVGAVIRVVAVRRFGEQLAAMLEAVAAEQTALRLGGLPAGIVELRLERTAMAAHGAQLLLEADAEGKLARAAVLADDYDDAEHHRTQAAHTRRRAARLAEEITGLDRHIAETAVTTTGEANLGVPAEIAGRMQGWSGEEDEPLVDALDRLGIHQSLRGRVDGTRMHLTAEARIPLLDGTGTTLPIAISLRLTGRHGAFTADELLEDWLRGQSVEDLAARWNLTAAGATKAMIGQLKAQHLASAAASVLATCPVVEVRRATLEPAPDDPWARNIYDTYRHAFIGRPREWAAGGQTRCRQILQALVGAGGHAALADLAAATGLSIKQVKGVAQSTKGRPPLAQTRNGVLTLIRCPHCDGWASHYVHTPETRDLPLLCPDCRRRPSAQWQWPAAYLRPWDQVVTDHGARSVAVDVPASVTALVPFETRIMDTAGAAAVLRVTESTINSWVQTGRLKTVPGPGRSRWYLRTDVERLRANRTRISNMGRTKPLAGLLSPAAAAERLGCSATTVRRLCERGLLEWVPVKHGRLTIRAIAPGALERYRQQTSRSA